MGIDPVGVDENNVHSHNRYAYANNNPYKFVDPDGNEAIENLLPEGAPVVAIGKAFAGLAAYSEGVLTGNEGLKNVAMEGMSENRQSNIEAIVLIGSMGRGSGNNGVKGFDAARVESTVVRTNTRSGVKSVEITRQDGSVIDISTKRVKEFVPNTHPDAPVGTLNRVKFPNAQPGSKGFKRDPTSKELDTLRNAK